MIRLELSKVKVFVPVKGSMLQCFRYKGHNPEMFIDLELPQESFKFMKDAEIHFGIRGNYELEDLFQSGVKKNRIDIYLPAENLDVLINALMELKNMRDEDPQG